MKRTTIWVIGICVGLLLLFITYHIIRNLIENGETSNVLAENASIQTYLHSYYIDNHKYPGIIPQTLSTQSKDELKYMKYLTYTLLNDGTECVVTWTFKDGRIYKESLSNGSRPKVIHDDIFSK